MRHAATMAHELIHSWANYRIPNSKIRRAQRAAKNNAPKRRRVNRPQSRATGLTMMRRVRAPVATSMAMGRRVPPRVRSNGASIRVTHTEFVGTVVSTSTAFNGAAYSVQPGLTTLFPWLAPIANRYESYKMRSLRFRYTPSVPTTTAGLVMMVMDFDAADPSPSTAGELLNMNDNAQAPVWKDVSFLANLAAGDKMPSHYVRAGPVSSTDIKTYDIGNFYIATEGVVAGTIGLLYVDYTLELYTPQINIGGFSSYGCTISSTGMTSSTTLLASNVVTGNAPFTISGTNTIVFNTPWSGVVTGFVTGTVLNLLNLRYTGTTATSIELMPQLSSSTQNYVCHVIAVSAAAGEKLVFHINSITTGTKMLTYFGSCPYPYLSPTMLSKASTRTLPEIESSSPSCSSQVSAISSPRDHVPTLDLTRSNLELLREFKTARNVH